MMTLPNPSSEALEAAIKILEDLIDSWPDTLAEIVPGVSSIIQAAINESSRERDQLWCLALLAGQDTLDDMKYMSRILKVFNDDEWKAKALIQLRSSLHHED